MRSSSERESPLSWGGRVRIIMAAIFGPELEFVSHNRSFMLWSVLATKASFSCPRKRIDKTFNVFMDPDIRSGILLVWFQDQFMSSL